jgi:hypothetical protein
MCAVPIIQNSSGNSNEIRFKNMEKALLAIIISVERQCTLILVHIILYTLINVSCLSYFNS